MNIVSSSTISFKKRATVFVKSSDIKISLWKLQQKKDSDATLFWKYTEKFSILTKKRMQNELFVSRRNSPAAILCKC